MLNRYPDRFLFGTDNVAPRRPGDATARLQHVGSDLGQLTPEAIRKVRMGNYERIFDAARIRVRAWEAVNVK